LSITELVVDTVSWTSYSPADDFNIISCYNKDTANDLKFRTNSSDPTTEITIPAGIEKIWGDYSNRANTQIRFPKNLIMGYFQSVVGTGPVKIEPGR
jgi:hypothetical protein